MALLEVCKSLISLQVISLGLLSSQLLMIDVANFVFAFNRFSSVKHVCIQVNLEMLLTRFTSQQACVELSQAGNEPAISSLAADSREQLAGVSEA